MNKKNLIYLAPVIAVIIATFTWKNFSPPIATSEQADTAKTSGQINTTITDKQTTALPSNKNKLLQPLFSPAPERAWSTIDINAVQQALPDNLYWELGSPTTDPLVLEQREELEIQWNQAYGKVSSGEADEQEVQAYYHYREQVSKDYVQFADYLLQHHSNELPERDTQLLKLTRTLHLSRLKEYPNQLTQALERSQAYAAKFEAWLNDKEAYEAKLKAQTTR